MTDTPSDDEKKAGHAFLNWARRWALHPTVVLVARVSVAGLAFGLGTAATYVVSIDSKVNALETSIDQNSLIVNGKFTTIDATINAMADRMDNGREDRIKFQTDALNALNKIIENQSSQQSALAAQAERQKAIEDRVIRIERKID